MTFLGRWDITVSDGKVSYPSWLEITKHGARFVGKVGSARPVPRLEMCEDAIHFELPPQYEGYPNDLSFDGRLTGDEIHGTTNAKDGSILQWKAVRAPEFIHARMPKFGQPIDLIGTSLDGWRVRWPEMENNWRIENGDLINSKAGTDIRTKQRFKNFCLLAEYSYPEHANSGIYLRGRYEVQVLDDYGKPPSVGSSAAIYGFLTPQENTIRPHGERNTLEITLIGREVTILLNGVTVHYRRDIPGITGGALDSNEAKPGPILLQGDHGPVTFHKLELTPITFR